MLRNTAKRILHPLATNVNGSPIMKVWVLPRKKGTGEIARLQYLDNTFKHIEDIHPDFCDMTILEDITEKHGRIRNIEVIEEKVRVEEYDWNKFNISFFFEKYDIKKTFVFETSKGKVSLPNGIVGRTLLKYFD